MPGLIARLSLLVRRFHPAVRPAGPYRTALGRQGTLGFYLAAAPARLGIAMTSLGILWLVHWRTHSFGSAGIVSGGFVVAEACVGPQVARLIDRVGQPRMLPPCLIIHCLAVAALVGAVAASAPLWLVTGIGIVAGASIPQIGALTGARWAWLLRDGDLLQAAYALESLSNGFAYLAGPVLVGTVAIFVHPMAGSLLAAGLVLVGGFGLALQPGTAPAPAGYRSATETGPAKLLRPGFAALLAINLCLGLYFGSMSVSTTAFAVDRGQADMAGPLYGVMSAASLVGGWLYGLRRWRTSPSSQLRLTLLLRTASCVPLLIVGTAPSLAAVLVLAGLFLGPTLILSAVLTQAVAERSQLTQAFTWLNSASQAGAGLASALAAHAVDTVGPRGGFGLALAACATAAAAAWVGRAALEARRGVEAARETRPS